MKKKSLLLLFLLMALPVSSRLSFAEDTPSGSESELGSYKNYQDNAEKFCRLNGP